MALMFDLSEYEGLVAGDNVAVYDEKKRVLMCFRIMEKKNGLVPVPLVTRHRKPDECVYIRDDDILFVKKEDGEYLSDVYDFPGIMRDGDIEDDENV